MTELLLQWKAGNRTALDALTPIVYQELHRLAVSYMRRENPSHTLQSTALIHEAYLKLVEQRQDWQNRAHFFGVAAQIMRRVLVDHARGKLAGKRGGNAAKISLDDAPVVSEERGADLLALDEALDRLAAFDPRKCQIVEMRYFGGMSIEEVGAATELSTATVGRELRLAHAWLQRELSVNPD